MAKRKPKSDSQEHASPEAAAHAGADAVTEPTAFDFPFGEQAAVALVPVPADAPPLAASETTGASNRPVLTGVDADGRVTYTVPADATPQPTPAAEGEEATRPFNPLFSVRADHEAGIGLLEDRRFKQMQIRFRDKPSDAVRQVIREAGYQWRSQDQAWSKQIDPQAAWRTRAEATTLFDRVAGMVRDELGLGREVG